jgi:hypothetical protein
VALLGGVKPARGRAKKWARRALVEIVASPSLVTASARGLRPTGSRR